MLKIRNLTVFDHAVPVLNNISLDIKRGEVVGLIGPNSSGKSALLKAVAGGYNRFDGEVRVNNFSVKNEPEKAKVNLGYLPSPVNLEAYLTGVEWLEVVGATYHLAPNIRIQRIIELADSFNCKESLYTTIDQISYSDAQKVGLIASLIHQPGLLVWDEPIQYLDPDSQQDTASILKQRASEGGAALIATNHLDWIEMVADRFLVIRDGEIIAEGTPAELRHIVRDAKRDISSIYSHIINGE